MYSSRGRILNSQGRSRLDKSWRYGRVFGDEQSVFSVVHNRFCRRRAGSRDAEREEVQSADLFWGARRWRVKDWVMSIVGEPSR